jgi:hypothetical protein
MVRPFAAKSNVTVKNTLSKRFGWAMVIKVIGTLSWVALLQ